MNNTFQCFRGKGLGSNVLPRHEFPEGFDDKISAELGTLMHDSKVV